MSYTQTSIKNLNLKATVNYNSSRKILQQLKKVSPQKLDKLMVDLHTKEFKKIDCLECANCCKTLSPAIFYSDIRRMASALKTKVSDFIDKYLVEDKDGVYVYKKTPCPFLDDDNYCIVYNSRPKACREYPHTNRKRFYQILDLTARNSKVCPAVSNIVQKLKMKT